MQALDINFSKEKNFNEEMEDKKVDIEQKQDDIDPKDIEVEYKTTDGG